MGRLNEQGLQRLVTNIKNDVNVRVENVKGDVEELRNNVNSLNTNLSQQGESILAIQNELGINKEALISNTIDVFSLY